MATTIRIAFIVLSFACCCHLHEQLSSYFTFSYQEQPHEDSQAIAEFQADTELACALRCQRKNTCDEALFRGAFKKCSLHKKKEKGSNGLKGGENKKKSRTLTLNKVAILTNNKREPSGNSLADKGNWNTNAVKGQKNTTGTSCRDILQRNSSSPTGYYNIKIGNITWRTRCRMKGISRCGEGVWERVMGTERLNSRFGYHSDYWTTQIPYRSAKDGGEYKLPGYWLRNFTKICVTMNFTANSPKKAIILVNYTAQSLYFALHEGVQKNWSVDLSTIKARSSIDKKCLVQGLNMLGPHAWGMKSRVGVVSRPSAECSLPYLVRGVGIGLPSRPEMSCGEIITSRNSSLNRKYLIETFPAFCQIYIQ